MNEEDKTISTAIRVIVISVLISQIINYFLYYSK